MLLADRPDAVHSYLDLATGGDRPSAIATFSDAAHVTDTGHDHLGTSEIRTWLDRAASEYTCPSTPLVAHADHARGQTTVTFRFPGHAPRQPRRPRFPLPLRQRAPISRLEAAARNVHSTPHGLIRHKLVGS